MSQETEVVLLIALAFSVLAWLALLKGWVAHRSAQQKEIEELQRKIDSVVQSRAPTDAPELEPCSNCEGEAIYVAGPGYNLVRCRECGLETHEAYTKLFDDPQKIVGQIWNKGKPDALNWENVKGENDGESTASH